MGKCYMRRGEGVEQGVLSGGRKKKEEKKRKERKYFVGSDVETCCPASFNSI